MQTTTTPEIMFEGGGTDVDAAYQWMCQKANGVTFWLSARVVMPITIPISRGSAKG
jgi:hypothetical protein